MNLAEIGQPKKNTLNKNSAGTVQTAVTLYTLDWSCWNFAYLTPDDLTAEPGHVKVSLRHCVKRLTTFVLSAPTRPDVSTTSAAMQWLSGSRNPFTITSQSASFVRKILPWLSRSIFTPLLLQHTTNMYWLIESGFYSPRDTIQVISQMLFPANLLNSTEKTKQN